MAQLRRRERYTASGDAAPRDVCVQLQPAALLGGVPVPFEALHDRQLQGPLAVQVQGADVQ